MTDIPELCFPYRACMVQRTCMHCITVDLLEMNIRLNGHSYRACNECVIGETGMQGRQGCSEGRDMETGIDMVRGREAWRQDGGGL